MKKAYRIGYNRYYKDEIFEKHLMFIRDNIDAVDEVALFVEYSHYGYWELKQQQTVANIIRKRITQYKEIGVKKVGINVLCTIGHTEEAWDVLPKPPMQTMVGRNGEVSRSCLCTSNDGFLNYITERYRLFAQTNPDFIWLDDDIRICWHGVEDPCYCPYCINKFNAEFNEDYTFESLAKNLDCDEKLKHNWDEFRENVLVQLINTIKNTIKIVNPKIEIGYMSTVSNSKKEWILKSGAVKGRPGGGFYNDETPHLLFRKTYAVGLQINNYPKDVSDIQYEFENFNYQTLGKSMTISELESAAALMYGCNGIIYNDIVMDDKPHLMHMVRKSSKLWDKITDRNENCYGAGVYCCNEYTALQFNEIGIPVVSQSDRADTYVILANEWNNFTDNEVKNILSKSVMTDGEGIKILEKRGFSDLCGGKVKETYTNGMAERFTDHEFNEEFKDYYRDVFMTFFHANVCHSFETAKNAQILSKLETISHEPLDCAMYIYCNCLGGKIAATGYLQPEFMKSDAKRRQIINVIRWLTDDKLPIIINKCHKIIPIVRKSDVGDMLIMLANASFDKTEEFECIIKSNEQMYQVTYDGNYIPVRTTLNNNSSTVTINNIEPWKYIILTNKMIDSKKK